MFFGLLTAAISSEEKTETSESDVVLVAAAKRGDSRAFAALHKRYYSRIYRLAYLKTNNVSDSEDVASETFLRALSRLSRFSFHEVPSGVTPSLYPWLHRIAVNLIVDTNRQRPPSGIVSLDAPIIAGMRTLLSDQTMEMTTIGRPVALTPQEVVERHEVQQLVRAAIAALPPDQGDVLVHRYLGDLSSKEIAAVMQRSESAVKSLLHRAVVALRGEIEQRLNVVERLEAQRHPPPVSEMEKQYVGRRAG